MSKDSSEINGASGADTNYEVGRGKPPVATQFAKGRSGNPSGKPPTSAPINGGSTASICSRKHRASIR